MQIEMEELETNPEGEKKELALIYIAKGIPEEQAHAMAAEIMKDTKLAHEVLVKEELGINAEELKGSAVEAAVYSFIMFAIGAVIPVIPFMFTNGMQAILISVSVSAAGLFNWCRYHSIYRKECLVLWFQTSGIWPGSSYYFWYWKIDRCIYNIKIISNLLY